MVISPGTWVKWSRDWPKILDLPLHLSQFVYENKAEKTVNWRRIFLLWTLQGQVREHTKEPELSLGRMEVQNEGVGLGVWGEYPLPLWVLIPSSNFMMSCTPVAHQSGCWLLIWSSPWTCRHRVISNNSYDLSTWDILERQKSSSQWGWWSLRTQWRGIPDSGLGFKDPPSSSPVSHSLGRGLKERRDEREWEKTSQYYSSSPGGFPEKIRPRNGRWGDGKDWTKMTFYVSYLSCLRDSHSSQGLRWQQDPYPRQHNWARQC